MSRPTVLLRIAESDFLAMRSALSSAFRTTSRCSHVELRPALPPENGIIARTGPHDSEPHTRSLPPRQYAYRRRIQKGICAGNRAPP